MTTIPKIKKPMSGLIFTRNYWRAEWRQDGKRLYRSMGTADPEEARKQRDAFYAELRERGALVHGTAERTTKRRSTVDPDGDKYIAQVKKPWVVKIGGEYLGCFATIEEARSLRNAKLGIGEL